jgi:hypothetical protein
MTAMNYRDRILKIYRKIIKYSRYPRYLIYGFIVFWIVIVWFAIPFPILNQQQVPAPYDWSFTYPQSAPNTLEVQGDMVYLEVHISTSNYFADNTNVRIAAQGSMGSFGTNVSEVMVGFIGAYPSNLPQNWVETGSPLGGVTLIPNATYEGSSFLGLGIDMAPRANNIQFRSSGNFPLTIEIDFNNDSNPISYTFQDLILPIQSSTTIRNAQVDYGIGVMAFGAIIIAMLDVLPLLRKDLIQQEPKTTQTKSDEDKGKRKHSRPSNISKRQKK